jgi:DNA-binding transcriptional LysR family regulator
VAVGGISITQLRYFVRTAERLSMTEAAKDLFMAQSAMSTAINQLEKSVGAVLFVRKSAKGLALTASGAELLVRARAILADLEDAVDAVRSDGLRGSLSAACYTTLAPFYLPELIDQLGRAHPEMTVSIRELGAEGMHSALRDGEVSVALTYDIGLGADIHRERLARAPVYAAVASDHPLADRGTVSLEDLAESPMVLLNMPTSRDFFVEIFTSRGITPTVRYAFEGFETVRAMVARGHGFTILNQRPVFDTTYDGHRLSVLRIDGDVPGFDIVVATAAGRAGLTAKVQAFADAARKMI